MATSNIGNDDTTKMNLSNDVTVNGRTFRAGTGVEVPKKQADDIARMDYDYNQYQNGLHKKREHTINAGTIAMGGSE